MVIASAILQLNFHMRTGVVAFILSNAISGTWSGMAQEY
jgi:hypothetical protein